MGTPASRAKPATGAQTLRANAQTAQNCALGVNGDCSFCQRQGVPILPLRYAVVPKFLKGRPDDILGAAPSLGTRLKDKALAHHKYTVRALRRGFVNVYLGKPGAWQVYAVTEAGHLRLLPNPDDPDAKTDRALTPQCTSQGHNIPASFINIPPRYAKGSIWVAFSNDLWTTKIRAGFEKAPSKRMQRCRSIRFKSHSALRLRPAGAAAHRLAPRAGGPTGPKQIGGQFTRGRAAHAGPVPVVRGAAQDPAGRHDGIGFTGPIFIMIGAYLFFREPMRWERWLATMLGFVGVLIVVGPKLQLGSAGGGGLYHLVMAGLGARGSRPRFW